jgi:predicted RNase H-like HicB family nuclease
MKTINRTTRKKASSFTAFIYPDADSDWLVAHNPETGTTTQGKTFEEALANLKEATELYLTEFPRKTNGRAIMTTFEISQAAHA